MSNVSGIAGAASALALNTIGGRPPHAQRPDRSQFLENLFSTLDTGNQGYLDKTGLQSALGKVGAAGAAANVDDLFAKLDANGDGKVTKQEFSEILAKLDDQMKSMRVDHARQPPAGLGAGPDEGLSQDQLTTLAGSLEKSDSGRAAVLRDLAQNFGAADADGDGRISHAEALKYAHVQPENGMTGAAIAKQTDTSTPSAGELVVRQLAQLLHAYGPFGAGNLLQAVSSGLSAIA